MSLPYAAFRRLASAMALAALVGVAVARPAAAATTIRYYALPSGAVVDDALVQSPIGANARGDVVANVALGENRIRRIVVWEAAGNRRILEPPERSDGYVSSRRETDFGVLAPDGTVFGVARYLVDGALFSSPTALLSWRSRQTRATRLGGASCTESGPDVAPVRAFGDGRLAFNGLWEAHVPVMDAIRAGAFAPTAGELSGTRCRAFDRAWLNALEGRYGAGLRLYLDGTSRPVEGGWTIAAPNLQPRVRAIAVRFVDGHATELGRGAAFGVDRRGDCVGTSAAPPDGVPVLWRDGKRIALSARHGVAYGITESGRTIVGTIRDAHGKPRAVRWVDGRVALLDAVLPHDRGTMLTVAYGVTPSGGIYGLGTRGGIPVVFVLYTS
jgi:hypothetical protein